MKPLPESFPSVLLVLTCGHEIHMLLDMEDDEVKDVDPWRKYDRSTYQPQFCAMRECRRFGVRQHPVARVKPYRARAYKRRWQA